MLKGEKAEQVFSRYGIDFEARRGELQRYNATDFDDLKTGDKLMIPLIWD